MHFQNSNLQSGLSQPWSHFLVPFSAFIPLLVMVKKKTLRKAIYSLKTLSLLTVWGTAHQGREVKEASVKAVGHIVFTIRKQRAMNTCCCSALFCHLCGPESQPQDGATHSGWVFQTLCYENNLPQACPEEHSLAASRVCQVININYQSEISLYDSRLIYIAGYA